MKPADAVVSGEIGQHPGKKQGEIIYISHGGGPLPILGDPGHQRMIDFMRALPSRIQKPDEILVVSAHWEEDVPTVIGHESPSLLYDYYGFPPEAYELEYPVPGNPGLSQTVFDLLRDAGIAAGKTMERGFDHGLFVPLMMMYPDADIPVTQLSLVKKLDPEEHIQMGKALSSLTDRNILIIGSGFSFHNMREFFGAKHDHDDSNNNEFQNWLIELCTGTISREEREQMLREWTMAPHARYCHPREEHLMPLHVCLAMAEDGAELIFDDYILGKRAVAFRW